MLINNHINIASKTVIFVSFVAMFIVMLGAEQYLGEKRWVERRRRTRKVGGQGEYEEAKLAILKAQRHLIICDPK